MRWPPPPPSPCTITAVGTITIAATAAAMPASTSGRGLRRVGGDRHDDVAVGGGDSAAVGDRQGALAQRRGSIGQRAGVGQHLRDAFEFGFELVAHCARSRYSARRASPLRVRVLTVPSGSPRCSAISLCVNPSL